MRNGKGWLCVQMLEGIRGTLLTQGVAIWTACQNSRSKASSSAGWPYPLVQQNVSMAFAWPANGTASAGLGRPTQQLSWTDSPLLFQYNQTTGKTKGQQPFAVSPPSPQPDRLMALWY